VLWDQDPSRTWVLLIALAPLLLRLLTRRRLIPRTLLDLPLLLFFLSAGIGILTSYDPRGTYAASPWMPPASQWIVGLTLAALVFYALAAVDSHDQLVWAMGLFAALGPLGAVRFVLTNDWAANLAAIPVIGGLGTALQGHSWPRLPIPELNANVAAGLLAMLWFFSLGVAAVGFRAIGRRRRWLWGVGGAATAVAIAIGLLLTISRGAWLAVAAAAGLAAAWVLAIWLARRAGWNRAQWLAVALVAVGVVVTAWVVLAIQLVQIASLGSAGSVADRAALYSESLLLARDYLFTGTGTGTFPAIHSTYALLIHVPVLIHAHNIYLHILVEQGLLGLAALIAMLFIPAVLGLRALISSKSTNPLLLAALASLAVEILHGVVDYPLYCSCSLLFLWVPAGFVLAACRVAAPGTRAVAHGGAPVGCVEGRRRLPFAAVGLLVLAVIAAGLFWRPIAAAWKANLGALAQTHAELQRYDYRHFGDPTLHQVRRAVDLSPAERYFRQALALDPTNATALTRLGAIALDRGEYAGGLGLVQAAWDAGHRDRVTRLLYGDALVAAGDVDAAVEIVHGLSHAAERFSGQAWNYQQNGDEQRAEVAAAAAERLK
jgi:O-antigen ligase